MSEELGIKTTREQDFAKWYLEVVRRGAFVDQRSPIKGFDVILPWGFSIWETIQKKMDSMLKKNDVKNAYFPMFIPEHLIKKEEEHFKGFKAEAFAVTEAGGEKMDEKLYVRPTSETIMYYMYSLWIRSYKDLPLKINQWNNVVRFDTKVTRPLLRGREFLWQEGHTAHATKEDAEAWIQTVVDMYAEIYKMLAIEPLILVRPHSDTFAGANFSVVFDTILQDGKVSQGPGTHMLGQHFSKPFEITYLDQEGSRQFVWQTSWGLSIRQIGILIMHHGDDKGAMLPPEISPIQVIIIPILFKGKEKITVEKANAIKKVLDHIGISCEVDERDYSAGFKFNEWELRGVPIRIEIGPKDIENDEVTIVNRITAEKTKLKMNRLEEIAQVLSIIQNSMLEKSRLLLSKNMKEAKKINELKEKIRDGGVIRTNWCGSESCEKGLKADADGAEIRGTLYGKGEKTFGDCIYCGKAAQHVVYVAKAY